MWVCSSSHTMWYCLDSMENPTTCEDTDWSSCPKLSTVDSEMFYTSSSRGTHGRKPCWQIQALNLPRWPNLLTAARRFCRSFSVALMDSLPFSELLNTLSRLFTGFSEIYGIFMPPRENLKLVSVTFPLLSTKDLDFAGLSVPMLWASSEPSATT